MKKYFYNTILVFLTLNVALYAQTSVTTTYTGGDEGLAGQFNPTVATNSSCPVRLSVPVPAGRVVVNVDVEYDLTSSGFNDISEQNSYLECVTTGLKEASITSGPATSTNPGTQSYARTGLSIADGVVGASGIIEFDLHGFRQFGFACDANQAKVDNNTFKITVYHIAAPTCARPTALNASAISTNSFQLDFTGGGATDWEIEYGAPGFTLGSGTRIATTSNPITISGLSASTNYEVYVRDSCGVGDVSLWSRPITVYTQCTPLSAPVTENFDGTNWVAASTFGSLGDIDTCWTRNYANQFTFVTGPPPFPSTFTGPSGDNTTGSGGYLFSELNSFFTGTTTAEIVSPPIDLGALSVPRVRFFYHAFGNNIGDLDVEISNDFGLTYSSVFSTTGPQQNSKAEAWKEAAADLSAYANDTILVRFKITQSASAGDSEFAIDDFNIEETPTCPKPLTVSLSSIWFDRFTIDATTSNANSFEVEFGAPGFAVGSGTSTIVNSLPANINGLSANTNYDVYIRSICAVGDSSFWAGPFALSTLCNPTTVPYTQNFDGSDFTIGTGFFGSFGSINNCFQRTDSIRGFSWVPNDAGTTNFGTGPSDDHTLANSTGKFVSSDVLSFFSGVNQAFFQTELFDMAGLTSPQLVFWYHMFGSDVSSLDVEVYDENGLANVLTLSGQQQSSSADNWLEGIVDLSPYANDTIAIRFVSNRIGTSTRSRIALDDVEIRQAPPCPKPTFLSLSGTGSTTATLAWTSGGATDWEIEYGAPGFALGSGTRVAVTTNPATITGLSPNTAYEFYVRDSCGLGDVSDWTLPVSGRTDCSALTAPVTENFDGTPFQIQNFSNDYGQVDVCWKRDTSVRYAWVADDGSNTSFNSGPQGDNTTGNDKFLMMDRVFSFGAPNNSRNSITSPPIDCGPLTIPELQFFYHLFGAEIDTLSVDVFDGTTWTREWSIVGQQQANANAAWDEALVDLSAYTNDTIKIRFNGNATSIFPFNANISIDDFKVREQPSCPKPSALTFVSAGANDVTFSWTSGGANDWIIEYGVSGFARGTGTYLATNSNPTTITGLSPSITYDFYVRDSCAAGDVSEWTKALTASTSCLPSPAPFFEDFEGAGFVSQGSFADSGTYASCWDRSTTNSRYSWSVGPPFFTSAFTGPSGDNTTGSGKYAYAESFFTGPFVAPFEARLETPELDLSTLTVPELSFFYHMFGNSMGDLDVEIDNGSGYTNILTISGQQQTSSAAAWTEQIIDLSAYANDTVRLRFIASKPNTGTGANVSIDDFGIKEAPSCPKPQSLQVVGTSSNGVTLSWTTGGATNWEIEYGTPGFTPGSGTRVAVNSNPASVSGLTPNTTYEFYVRDSCAVGDVSDWSNVASARTACAVTAAPFLEDFDGSNFQIGTFASPAQFDPCWSRDTSTRYQWTVGDNTSAGFNSGPSGDNTSGNGKYLFTDRVFSGSTFVNSDRTEVESPIIDLSPLTNPELKFYYHMFGNQIDSMVAEVFDGQNWTQVWFLQGQQQSASTDAWLEENVSLSAFANDTIKVRFRGVSTTITAFSNNMAIDDFEIREAPNCPRPNSLATVSTSPNSIELGWTTGGASNWIIEYGQTGFTKGTGTFIAANANPFTVTGLLPGTTYDFYLRDSCGVANVSDWTAVYTESTGCAPISTPYFEDFETSTFILPTTGFNDSGSFAVCWDRSRSSGRYFWSPGPPAFPPFNTGPQGDHTTGNGKYVFAEAGFGPGNSPFEARLETPSIDLSQLTTPELSFYYHMFGQDIGSLDVEIDNGSGYSNLTTFTGEQQFASTDAWIEEIIDLSSYANDTIRLRFVASKTGFGNRSDVAIDDISIDEAPSCPKPSGLQVTNVTANSITLNWTSSGSPVNFDVEYGAPGFALGSGTTVSGATLPITITGLTPNTIYDFYVRDECTAGDFSEFTDVLTDTTDCGTFSIPYTEDFENNEWTVSNSTFNPGTISACYTRTFQGNFGILVGKNGTQSNNTGPDQDNTTGNGKFVHTDGFSNSADVVELTLPAIDISSATNPEWRFWYHMFGTQVGSLKAQAWNATTSSWTTLATITGQQQTSSTAAWQEQVVSLSSITTNAVALRLVFERSSGFGTAHDMAVDDMWVGEQPTCARPSNLAFNSATTTSIGISWTSGGAANALVKYRPSGSGLPFSFLPVTTSPATITGLAPSTSYEILIADSCGTADLSLYEGILFANTSCAALGLPFAENFESGSWQQGSGFQNTGDEISPCWSRSSNTSSRWSTGQGATPLFNSGPSSGINSGKYIYITKQGFGPESIEITSSEISINSAATNPKLYFNYHMFGANIDSLAIKVVSGGTASGSLWSKVGQQQTAKTSAWILDSIDLNAYLGQTIEIRFIGYVDAFGANIAIDEVSVRQETAPCPSSTGLSFSNVTPTSVDIAFTQGGNSSNILVYPNATGPGSGTLYTNVTNPFTITGLMAGTQYTVDVIDSCTNGTFSDTSSISFPTSPCVKPTAQLTTSRTGLTVNYDASASTLADSVYIIYGDGNSSSSQVSSNTYGTPGTYTYQLIVFNNCGESDTIVDSVQVCNPITGQFTFTQNGAELYVDGSASTGATGWYWEFGDGNTGSGMMDTNSYAGTGNFTVSLYVFNDCGDTANVISQIVSICQKPVAIWTYNIVSTTGAGMLVQFDATASLNASTYDWSFGDGNTAVGTAVPTNLYLVPSLNYLVTCTAKNACGESDVSAFKLNEISLTETELESNIQVYPVPASNVLNVEFDLSSQGEFSVVKLYNAAGSLVFSEKLLENETTKTIDISSLPNGIYQLRFAGSAGNTVNKRVQVLR